MAARLCMLITHHDEKSRRVCEDLRCVKPTLFRPVALSSINNPFFEAQLFDAYHKGDLALSGTLSHIGHVAYSYTKKIPAYDFEKLVTKYTNHDVIALAACRTHTLYRFADRWHPGFMDIWQLLMRRVLGDGCAAETCLNHDILPFYCNYWIAKKPVFDKFCEFVSTCMSCIRDDPKLAELCLQNSAYQGGNLSPEQLIAIGGRPYYTFHPFVAERLMPFFVAFHGHSTKYLFMEDPNSNEVQNTYRRRIL